MHTYVNAMLISSQCDSIALRRLAKHPEQIRQIQAHISMYRRHLVGTAESVSFSFPRISSIIIVGNVDIDRIGAVPGNLFAECSVCSLGNVQIDKVHWEYLHDLEMHRLPYATSIKRMRQSERDCRLSERASERSSVLPMCRRKSITQLHDVTVRLEMQRPRSPFGLQRIPNSEDMYAANMPATKPRTTNLFCLLVRRIRRSIRPSNQIDRFNASVCLCGCHPEHRARCKSGCLPVMLM